MRKISTPAFATNALDLEVIRLLRVQSQQLPTESQVLEDEVLRGTENAYQPAEEMSERHDHQE